MDILEKLANDIGGNYNKDDLKRRHSPGGAFISQNSYAIFKKEKYVIKVFCFDNMGVRAASTIDGSPFKIVLIIPFSLKSHLSIFPKSFFQKLISSLSSKSNSVQGEKLLKKYSLKGNRELRNYILKDSNLSKSISEHIVYVRSDIKNKFTLLSLRPNESVTTKEDLKALYNIMDRMGNIIIENKTILMK
jgi:hypothetical protein